MRLIDADALLKGKQDHEMISTHIIWNAPTVDAEPIRHGHWINDFGSPLKCSSCGIVGKVNEITLRADFKFCPNCGAKMDESETYSAGHNTNETTTVESNEDKLRSMLHDCRNELCLNCGLYKSAYQGACDNCRWASGKEWDKI